MHVELEELVARSLKFAIRKLRETGTVPLFPAVLDQHGQPLFLNVHLHEEYEAPPSTGGMVELLRAAIRKTETSGAVFCAPVILTLAAGATHDALQLHADHIDDPCAYTVTLPYRIDENGELQGGEPITAETDDLILPR